MTLLDLIEVIITTVSVSVAMGFILYIILDWYNRKKQKATIGLVQKIVRDDEIVQLMHLTMKKDVNKNQRAVLKHTISRISQIPLVDVLKIDKQREYLFKALTKPDVYPWEDESLK